MKTYTVTSDEVPARVRLADVPPQPDEPPAYDDDDALPVTGLVLLLLAFAAGFVLGLAL